MLSSIGRQESLSPHKLTDLRPPGRGPHGLPVPPGDPGMGEAGDTGWSLAHGDGDQGALTAGFPTEADSTGRLANQKGENGPHLNTEDAHGSQDTDQPRRLKGGLASHKFQEARRPCWGPARAGKRPTQPL